MSTTETLARLIAAGPMPAEDVVRIGSHIAAALPKTHGELFPLGITVYPDRVTIDPPGVADRAQYGPYAAPERILGASATAASDVYSLGAILYHALAGHHAFEGDSPAAVMMSACTDAPQAVPAHVPRALAAVVLRCLAADPAERYANPAQLRAALERVQMRDVWPGRRILVADDDPSFRALFQLAAAKVGVEADIVASGREAITALKARHYDVMLMDLNMPHLSGWEVLDFLRSRFETRPRRLFIITGFRDQDISAADRGLVSAALYKPVALDDLRALVTAALGDADFDLPSILRNTRHRVFPST
jgi:CheY-like chemotaxis protein